MQRSNNAGFTLIELSIVLVIIGLVVGGVLIGRDLIDAASIRAQISQFEEYKTALTTFKLKYNCLPGDCNQATAFGLGNNGDGDEVLESTIHCFGQNTSPDCDYSGESSQFFVHLKAASLIKYIKSRSFGSNEYPLLAIRDSYGMIAAGKWQTGSTGTAPDGLTTNYNFPAGFWLHATVCNWAASVMASNDGCGVMTPVQAQKIDEKIDDNYPLKGKVWSYSSGAAPASANPCLNATSTAYNLTNTNPYCQMSVRIW